MMPTQAAPILAAQNRAPNNQLSEAATWLRSPLVTAGLALLYCVWILSLPLFPTQDGPMHLYFTQVLREVLRHPDGFYGHFYFVRHLLPPYSLYYYALMALGSGVSLPSADRIIVCGYIVSFCFGFRYLARAIGPAGDVGALAASVLVLNWPLGMGFINFSLSTTFAFWALGLWCRFADRQETRASTWRRAGFVLLCCVILLTHPVPLLLIGCFGALHLAMAAFRRRAVPVRDAATLLLGMLTLGYVRLFTNGHMLRQVHTTVQRPVAHKLTLLKGYALLHNTAVFAGRGVEDAVYRAVIYLLFAASLGVAVWQWVRDRRVRETSPEDQASRTVRHAWALLAVLLVVGFPLVPEDLNNSAYFAARMTLYVWLAAVLAGSAAAWRSRWVRPAAAVAVLLVTAVILHMAVRRIGPVAREIAAAERPGTVPEHQVGLLLHAPDYEADHAITFDPFFWNGVRIFRRTGSVMFNTPWLDLPIIPLGPRPVLPTYRLSANDLEYPPGLRTAMLTSGAVREDLLSHVDLVVFSAGAHAPAGGMDELLRGRQGGWSCAALGLLTICQRPASQVAAAPPIANKPR